MPRGINTGDLEMITTQSLSTKTTNLNKFDNLPVSISFYPKALGAFALRLKRGPFRWQGLFLLTMRLGSLVAILHDKKLFDKWIHGESTRKKEGARPPGVTAGTLRALAGPRGIVNSSGQRFAKFGGPNIPAQPDVLARVKIGILGLKSCRTDGWLRSLPGDIGDRPGLKNDARFPRGLAR